MKIQKRVICLLLVFSLLSVFSVPVWGSELESAKAVTSSKCESYAFEAMKRYIGIHALGTNLKMTQPIPIYNRNSEGWAFFLFDGTDCLGMMLVSQVDGSFVSSFHQSNYDEIESFLSRGIPFSLIAWEDSLLLVGSKSICVLSGNTNVPSKTLLEDILVSVQPQAPSLTSVSLTNQEAGVRSASYVISVPKVQNLNCPDTGLGLCWAAAAASIIDYWSSSYDDTMEAMDVYRRLCSEYGTDNGYPVGNRNWIQRAYIVFNIPMTYVGSGATYDTVKQIIEVEGCPIHASLSGGNGSHSVVICGFTSGYGYYYYVLMDPNDLDYVTVEVQNRSSTSFTYPSSSGNYTNWFRYFY